MGFYEFACPACESAFGISIEGELDPTELFCVECGGCDLQLTAYDQELSLRLASLVDSVNELSYRVKNLEDECGTGPDDTAKKSKDEVN